MRASTLAWTQAQVQLRHLGISAAEANLFQRLAGYCMYRRCFAAAFLRRHTPRRQAARPGCGAQGISGDLPIVLLRIDAVEDIAIARQLLQAHEYWRMKRLAVDLVILNERAASYVQDLQIALETLLRMSQARMQVATDGVRGNVYILRTDIISAATRDLLSSVARVVLVGQRGSLADQLDRPRKRAASPARDPSARNLLARALRLDRRRRSWSSSMAWVASRRTDASTSPCSGPAMSRRRRGST